MRSAAHAAAWTREAGLCSLFGTVLGAFTAVHTPRFHGTFVSRRGEASSAQERVLYG